MKKILLRVLFALPLLVLANPAHAFDRATAVYDILATDLATGYRFASAQGDFSFAVPAAATANRLQVTLERYPDVVPVPATMHIASDMWVYEALAVQPDGKKVAAKFSKSALVSVPAYASSLVQKKLYFWDKKKALWLPLGGSQEGAFVVAKTKFAYMVIAAFEDGTSVIGKGSWFRHKLPDTAASNDFPMGSRLRVTDVDNKKSVDVTVRSTGPFVPGRVIDLAKGAFQKLRPTSTGVGVFLVELIKKA